MAYSDFTLGQLKEKFGIRFIENVCLFPDPQPFPVPERLADILRYNLPLALAIDTEKARSELIIAPVLIELKRQFNDRFSFFSGIDFNVDPAQGLNGKCDYILSKSEEQLYVAAPILVMVEAKNDRVKEGIPQCIAEMIAAKRFNEARSNPISTIYGAVSTGSLWKFLKLEDSLAYIDTEEYHTQVLDRVMGILAKIVTT